MKKLLLCLFLVATLTNVIYPSFPVTENNTVLTITNFEDPDDESNEPSLIIYILRGVLLASFLFFLIRAWIKAWRNRVRWVRVLTWVILIGFALMMTGALILSLFMGGGMGG